MRRLVPVSFAIAGYMALSALLCNLGGDRDGAILRIIAAGVWMLVALRGGGT